MSILSAVFWTIDARSRSLINMAKPGLEKYEAELDKDSQLFTLDRKRGNKNWIRYTYAFGALFIVQLLFGICTVAYGLCTWTHR